MLAEALWKAASQQLRNMDTVGGNLLQRTPCLYFRNGADGIYPCNKREPGSGCAAIGGIDRGQAVLGASPSCTAVSPGDWPAALVAMDAHLEVLGPGGARTMPVADLLVPPGDAPNVETTLAPGEMITAIVVPRLQPAGPPPTTRSASANLAPSRSSRRRWRWRWTATWCVMRAWRWAAWAPFPGAPAQPRRRSPANA